MFKKKLAEGGQTKMQEKFMLLKKKISKRKDPRTLKVTQETEVKIYNSVKIMHHVKEKESFYQLSYTKKLVPRAPN